MPAKGDGITKRDDGRFMARYTVHTPDGPKRKTIYGRKYKEVEKLLAEARGDAARGLVFDAENLKLGEYLARWLADSVADTVRPTTFERYEQIVRVHIRPALGNLKLKSVTPAHVRSLYREKLEAGLSPRTVQYIHVTLHKALKQAVADGLIPRNTTEAVRPPQVRKEEIRPLTAEQVKALFEAVRGDRLEALYILAVHTGLRQGELLGLKWGDVDLEAGTLQVRRTLTTAKGGPVLSSPKTKGSRRTVKLSQTALEALRRLMRNELDQQVRQVAKRPAERSVDSLGAGIRCDFGRKARQQPAQSLRPVALHTEEVLQLAYDPFYDLALAGRPTTIGFRPRPAGVLVRGGGYQSPVLLQPAPLPLHPRKAFVCQVRVVAVAGHEGVCYGPLVGGGLRQPEGGDDAPRIYHQRHLEAVDPLGL